MPDGSLLVVSMTKRQVLRRDARRHDHRARRPRPHRDFHCNDMVVDAAGGAYVGNFGFDLDAEMAARGVEAVIADHPTAKLAW